MKLQDIMSKNLKSVSPDTTLGAAAELMKESGVGMLPVLGLGLIPVGVITDRDIAIRAFASGMPATAPVREAMTKRVYTILQDREVGEALRLMETANVSRLLVCDTNGHLTGVFSLADASLYLSGDEHPVQVSRALAIRDRKARSNALATAHR